MPRNRKNKPRGKQFPTYDKMPSIDVDEFITAINWAMNAATGKAHITDVTKKRIDLVFEDGVVRQLEFADTPIARAVTALNERYKGDTDKYVSISMRIFALLRIAKDPALSEWSRVGEDGIPEIHEAVIEAAATLPFDSEGGWDVEVFTAKVKELAETKYKDKDL